MNIYVLDKSLNKIDVIDDYESVIWTTRYFTYGDFELTVNATIKYINLLQRHFYLVREQDIVNDEYHNVMIILNRQITTDEEEGDKLTVKGYCLKSILKRRVIVNQTILNGKVEDCVKQLISENIVNPTDASRQITNFKFGTNNLVSSNKMSLQVTGDNLEETVYSICTAYGYGYDIYINEDKEFVFYMYEGADRSYAQDENPHVVFSNEFDNLLSSNYEVNGDNYANVAIVAGEGEGVSRKKVSVGSTTGLERFEVYVDSRNSSTNDGTISDTDYYNMLIEEGNETLLEAAITTKFEGEVDNTINYELNVNYFLGDLVQVENDYKIQGRARIIEVIHSEDETGETIIPTFSDMEGV